MNVEALVRRGKNKERCEDRCLIGRSVLCDIDGWRELDPPFIVAVADGVGGNRLGDMAAGFVLQRLAECDAGAVADADAVRRLIRERNEELIALSAGIAGAHNMATTLTGILINSHGGWLFHAGNTRIYTIEGARVRQLTHDHTTYAWLMKAGREDEARQCNRSEITCCMGNGNPVQLEQLEVAPLSDFSALLLTSDGVHDALSDAQIESVLSRADSPEQACRLLCDSAQMLGARDDLTAVLVY